MGHAGTTNAERYCPILGAVRRLTRVGSPVMAAPRRARGSTPCLLVLVALAAAAALSRPRPAAAQEIKLTGPLAGSTNLLEAVGDRVTARHDVVGWLAFGGTPAPERAAASFSGLGAQITGPLGFAHRRLGFPAELRWGAWGQMWSDGRGGRGEGGLALQLYFFGRHAHSPVDLRLGAGRGDDLHGRSSHLTITVSGGPRYIEAVPWPGRIDRRGQSVPLPQLVAGWRFFLSARRTLDEFETLWVSGGVELELGFTERWR
jgi:hypothetical protein